MKNILYLTALLVMGLYQSGYTQQETIIVESKVYFEWNPADIYRYSNKEPYLHNLVSFELMVINRTQKNIPDLNYINRDKYVLFYINGKKEDKILHTIDESFSNNPDEWIIKPGESDTFRESCYFDLGEKYGYIYFYGTEFTVQWEYQGIKSEMYKVNMKTKTAELVKK